MTRGISRALKPGAYSQTATLSKLDRRTREGRLMREVRADLVKHVGGRPSATQRALIERAVQLSLRVAIMDKGFAQSHTMTDHDSRTYLAWSNSLTRTLRELGTDATKANQQSLRDYLANPDGAR